MNDTNNDNLRFPEGFLWGTSNAAYQIEGAWDADGKAPSIWDIAIHSGQLPVPEGSDLSVASDEYHRLSEDLDLLGEIGAPVHRFSVSWPRIIIDDQKTTNPAGLDYYDRLVDGLLERGIRPAACLYHWDTPQWLEDRCGGWMGRESVDWFTDFTHIMAQRLGDRVDQWYTMNEPSHPALAGYVAGMFPPMRQEGERGFDAVHNILLAHGMSVRALREENVKGSIGVILAVIGMQPATSNPDDIAAADRASYGIDRMMLDPLLGRGHVPTVRRQVEEDGACRDNDMEIISEPLDVLGVNWYSSLNVASTERAPKFYDAAGVGEHAAGLRQFGGIAAGEDSAVVPAPGHRWWDDHGFRQDTPGGLKRTLEWVHREYPDHPRIIVTENGRGMEHRAGAAHATGHDGGGFYDGVHDLTRIAYLTRSIQDLRDIIAGGIDVGGYYIWSSIDNIQWMNGFRERFGLVHVNADSLERERKDSFFWFSKVVESNGACVPSSEEAGNNVAAPFDGDAAGIVIHGVPNARGIGGLMTVDGHHRLRNGLFLRSAGLNFMTPEGRNDLQRLGVRTIVDLRDSWEVTRWPYEVDGIEVLRIPLLAGSNPPDGSTSDFIFSVAAARLSGANGEQTSRMGREILKETYRNIVDNSGSSIAYILTLLAEGNGPMLIHCTAGKDRTGIVAAVLEAILGVDDESIVSSYAQSAGNLGEAFRKAISSGMLDIPNDTTSDGGVGALAGMLASPASLMREMLGRIRSKHCTVAQYCLDNGMTKEHLEQLRSMFLEPID